MQHVDQADFEILMKIFAGLQFLKIPLLKE